MGISDILMWGCCHLQDKDRITLLLLFFKIKKPMAQFNFFSLTSKKINKVFVIVSKHG